MIVMWSGLWSEKCSVLDGESQLEEMHSEAVEESLGLLVWSVQVHGMRFHAV